MGTGTGTLSLAKTIAMVKNELIATVVKAIRYEWRFAALALKRSIKYDIIRRVYDEQKPFIQNRVAGMV